MTIAMAAFYSATKRFDPSSGEEWTKFIQWSGLSQLHEVVSLDSMLCPSVIEVQEFTDEDWGHNVNEDYRCHLFHDLEYLLRKVINRDRINILALMQNPTETEVCSFSNRRFMFRGFDPLEVTGGISALVNCEGFPKAFDTADLSSCGLLECHAKALTVQNLLKREYSEEHHAACDVWAIWQLKDAGRVATV